MSLTMSDLSLDVYLQVDIRTEGELSNAFS